MGEYEGWEQDWKMLARLAEYNGKPEEAQEFVEELREGSNGSV